MIRKLGEIFYQKDTKLQVVENDSCIGCFYNKSSKNDESIRFCSDLSFNGGICCRENRDDDTSVSFNSVLACK